MFYCNSKMQKLVISAYFKNISNKENIEANTISGDIKANVRKINTRPEYIILVKSVNLQRAGGC